MFHAQVVTALLKIVNDLLSALNEDKVSLLSLLVLSAAFGTTDRSILLSHINYSDNSLEYCASQYYWPLLILFQKGGRKTFIM